VKKAPIAVHDGVASVFKNIVSDALTSKVILVLAANVSTQHIASQPGTVDCGIQNLVEAKVPGDTHRPLLAAHAEKVARGVLIVILGGYPWGAH